MVDPEDFKTVINLLDRQEELTALEGQAYLFSLALDVGVIICEQRNRKRGYSK